MAAYLLASGNGHEPSRSELTTALAHLETARRSPGRIGWAVAILLEGKVSGSRLAQAIDIVIRVAGYDPPIAPDPSQGATCPTPNLDLLRPRRRRRHVAQPDSNQPMLPGFSA
jgi:hypothetical protein